jgi:hypothetical protein
MALYIRIKIKEGESKSMKKFFAVLGLVLVAAMSLSADVYIKTKTHQDAVNMMGQSRPAQDTFSEQWIGDNQFAVVSSDQTIITDLKKNLGYIIDHKTKTYTESTLPIDMTKLLPPEAAGMMGAMKMTATVTPNGETKKVGSWACTGYTMTMSIMGMSMTSKLWATTDVPFDVNVYNQKFLTYALKGLGPMMDESVLSEMKKIKGFQVASEMDMMGMKVTTEVQEITKKNPPAGVYAFPAGYTKK